MKRVMHRHEWRLTSQQQLSTGLLNRWGCWRQRPDGLWCRVRAVQDPKTGKVLCSDELEGRSWYLEPDAVVRRQDDNGTTLTDRATWIYLRD